VKGIEPSSSAWKAVALPLSYTRTRSSLDTKDRRPALANPPSPDDGLRPSNGLGAQAFAFGSPAEAPKARRLVGEVGLEPTKASASGFTVRPLCRSGHSPAVSRCILTDTYGANRPGLWGGHGAVSTARHRGGPPRRRAFGIDPALFGGRHRLIEHAAGYRIARIEFNGFLEFGNRFTILTLALQQRS
jgi:hypothetical protein